VRYYASPELPTREAVFTWAATLPGTVVRLVACWAASNRSWRASAAVKP
jgi:hypothetical protein